MRTRATALCLTSTIALFACTAPPADETDHLGPGEAPPSEQQAALTPSDVYIESISTGGVGCPDPSTVTTVISTDKTAFLVIYDQMILNNPPGPAIKNINCVAGVKLHVPNGWQVSIATVDTRGYAYLSPGVKARQTSEYFFAGVPLGSQFHTELKGFFDDNYVFTDEIPFESIVWSPCGTSAIFAINTKLNLNAVANPKGLAYFNTETTDGKFEKILHWQWKPC